MQSAQTATLVARVAIVFFMARSSINGSQRWQADLTDLTVVAAVSFEMPKTKFH
jgi:hypothetical protein